MGKPTGFMEFDRENEGTSLFNSKVRGAWTVAFRFVTLES